MSGSYDELARSIQEYTDQALSIPARLCPILDSIFILRGTLEALTAQSLDHMANQSRVQQVIVNFHDLIDHLEAKESCPLG